MFLTFVGIAFVCVFAYCIVRAVLDKNGLGTFEDAMTIVRDERAEGMFVGHICKNGDYVHLRNYPKAMCSHCTEGYNVTMPIDEAKALEKSLAPSTTESYMLVAIKNLLRRQNFQELTRDFENKEITEIEYQKELQDNPQKYVIEIRREVDSDKDMLAVNDIINKIGRDVKDFDTSDVQEMFSVHPSAVHKFIKENA